ncbi:MAG TPA: hypothetical protein VF103_01810 [Polyangiaceae bacterium]
MIDRDPLRLTDPASGAPDELRALFDAGTRDLPSDAQLSRLSVRLGPLLGATGAPAGGGAAPGASAAGMGKLAAVVALLAGGAVLVAKLTHEVPTNVPDARPLPAKQGAPSPETPTPTPVAPLASEAEPRPSTDPVPAEHSTAKREPRSNAEAEVELLERARAALAGNPSRALALTTEHKLRFPGGALAQEREVIAIEALRKLGRTEQATLRADEFAKNYPGSAHRHKLDAGVTR